MKSRTLTASKRYKGAETAMHALNTAGQIDRLTFQITESTDHDRQAASRRPDPTGSPLDSGDSLRPLGP